MPFCRRNRLDQIESLLYQVLANQNQIAKEIQKMAATQADLDAAIQQEGTDLNTLQTTVQGLIAKLGSNPDFTNEVTQLKAFDAAINALNASASGQPPASTGTASGS